MALITLVEFKTYLQIPTLNTDYDAGYAAFIEEVSADVEKIANQFFELQYSVNTVISSQFLSSTVELYDLFAGIVVTGAGIPDRTILQDVGSLYQVTMNKYATAGAAITATFNPVPIQIKPVIANMVMFKIKNSTATKGGDVKDLKSKGIGPVSKSFGSGAGIDSKYGYPKNHVKSIKNIRRVAFDTGKLRSGRSNITNRSW